MPGKATAICRNGPEGAAHKWCLSPLLSPFPPGTPDQVSDAQFARYAELIHARTGIRVLPQKKILLSNRLRRRLRATRVSDFEAYYQHLKRLPQQHPEWDAFLQEITTHETYLFRDQVQWDWLRSVYLPVGRRGTAAGVGLPADLVGRLQHRRRGGDRGLLDCRLPARPPTMAGSHSGNGYRRGGGGTGRHGRLRSTGHALVPATIAGGSSPRPRTPRSGRPDRSLPAC